MIDGIIPGSQEAIALAKYLMDKHKTLQDKANAVSTPIREGDYMRGKLQLINQIIKEIKE